MIAHLPFLLLAAASSANDAGSQQRGAKGVISVGAHIVAAERIGFQSDKADRSEAPQTDRQVRTRGNMPLTEFY